MSVERKLAAILAADVVGYSRLMEADEAGTLEAMKAHRRELWTPLTEKHGGRIVGTAGDSLLVEFASAVAAVECAVAVQRGMAERNAELAQGRRMELRMGINIGEVIVDGDDIHGEGVNIAARLEALSEPGGVALSGNVHEQVQGKLDESFEDAGEHEVKNITRPIRVWRWSGERATAAPSPPPALPDKPSIAVLPFDNMSGDAEQEYFSDGITEDIITGLSRVRWFLVIARNSSFAYKGRSIDVKQVARELGVRYVLEGSVRKAGNRVRITAQLIDGASGSHLWAERYDRGLEDVFALQDEITETVVATIEPHLYAAEGARARRRPPDNLTAWDLVMRALPHIWRWSGSGNTEARELLTKAVALDPDYAQAHSLLSLCHILHVWMSWGDVSADALRLAGEAARTAVTLDEQDPWAHLVLGMTYAYARKHPDAIASVRKAIDLNPSFAIGHSWLGVVLGYAGEWEEALEALDQAIRINPNDTDVQAAGMRGVPLFTAGRYEEAAAAAREGLRERPEQAGFWRLLVISLAHAGHIEEAHAALAETKKLQPNISLAWAREFAPWARPDDMERYLEGFRLAGLEE
jgi:TolB-like protein/cytochrome c-type biogenesis protein CcmH/NrfG